MRLLITTQVVDENDASLGFMCNWLRAFAPKFERIEVICLKEGTHRLPENVRVHTLGKEHGGNRFLYALRFVSLSWKLRKEYDAVFVHMNPEYLLLAGDLWMLAGKPIGLWYNHEVGSLALRLAAPFATRIFHTSPYAYTARYPQARLMPAGIDTELFKPTGTVPAPHSVYLQGRVAPAKRVGLLLAAVRVLRGRGIPATATIVGPEVKEYGAKLRNDFKDLEDAVSFLGPKKNEETPALYASHTVAVNLAAAGNFDKTALEPMACGTSTIVASPAFSDLVPGERCVEEPTPERLADALAKVFVLTDEERRAEGERLREGILAKHSLAALAERLALSYPV